MGTNYYMMSNACQHCGRGEQELHIGKSSMGWCFSLNTHPDDNIHSLEDWRAAWAANPIRDEYQQAITPAEMERIITQRVGRFPDKGAPLGYESRERFFEMNDAEPGPCGLLRHRVDGRHCIAHGEGTYDIMRGEFC